MELYQLPAYQIAQMIRNRKIKAVDVTQETLENVKKVDGFSGCWDQSLPKPPEDDKIHAFITLTVDHALQQAQIIDEKIKNHEDAGLLCGVPFTVKDIFTVKGTPSSAGSRILANFIAPYTATPIELLQAAGAIMIGKVNLDEFTYGSSNESSAFQPSPRNPWNRKRVPGGSSGGSAAAVAAFEGAFSIGTDTAGSIRQPAAFCGVVGLKPTYGRVSRYGLIAFGSSLDCPGPVTRNVTDAAMILNVIAGKDSRDSTTTLKKVPDYTALLEKNIQAFRIGISPDYLKITYINHEDGSIEEQPISKEIMDTMYRVAETLSKAGAEIIENVPMPHTRYGIPAYFVISRVEAASNLHRYDGVKYGYRTPDAVDDLKSMYRKTRAQGFGVQPKLRILMGMYVSAAQYSEQYYQRALRVRSLIRRDFEDIFNPNGKYKLNALLTPTTPTTAFPLGDIYGDSVLMQYADQLTVTANHAGIPAISIPAGFDNDGLPIGVQFLGADFTEATLLQISRAYELASASEDWRSRKLILSD